MPTGYTARIKDGIDFKTFALDCARAFGACVTLRDEPGGGERIPDEFLPSSYHREALDKARAELARLAAMSPQECERAAAKEHDDAVTRGTMRDQEEDALREKYERMLAQVQAWTPPTGEHAELKSFMVQQLTESLRFDCGGRSFPVPDRLSGSEWLEQRKDELAGRIEYHDASYAKEVERAKQRTEWVRALRESLK